ncbi:substrate-binding domain-containing protein [Leifsonia bigeumensis]|uniref:Substrate-binding domain-containing protein n=1 Tax=Leifsonella bigeumensis TaxID=433643 RepID=A0ABP7FN55_9MICO
MQTITLFSGLALKDVLEDDIIGPFIEKTGAIVRRVYEPTMILRDMVRNGEAPDVLVGVTSTLHEMAADGDVHTASIRGLVRSEVGAAVSEASSLTVAETVTDFQDLMRRVSSVAYSATGASGAVFQQVLTDLGLTDVVTPKAVVLPKGFTAEAVRDGRAEIAIQQISELAAVSDVRILGPLPADLGAYVELSTAIGTNSGDEILAERLILHLSAEEYAPAYRRAHLTPIAARHTRPGNVGIG